MTTRAVPQSNLEACSLHVEDRAGILLREGRVALHNNVVAAVEGDTTEGGERLVYRVRRERVGGEWHYRCTCMHAGCGYQERLTGTSRACCHILAAHLLWKEQKESLAAELGAAPSRVFTSPSGTRPAAQHPEPTQGHWRQADGWTVLVSGRTVFESGRGSDPPYDWARVAPYEVERVLRLRGFRPLAEWQAEEDLAELGRLLA